MFTGKPVPFAKLGGMFADTTLGKFLADIKRDAGRITNSVKNFFAQEFINPLRRALNSENFISSPLNDLNQELEYYTADNYLNLQAALPLLFSNTEPSIVTARTELLNRLGQVQDLNTSNNYKLGPFTLGELTSMADEADSLSRTLRSFEEHTDNLSGLGGSATVKFRFERIYGNVTISNATVNIASTNTVSPNLSLTRYPVVNIGDTVVVNSLERVVIGKNFVAAPAGTVTVSGNTVTSSDVGTLNLANCLLDTGGSLVVGNGTYISVNNEVRQVSSVNSLGDFLTVHLSFYNPASSQTFYKEASFNVNTAFATTSSDLTISLKTSFVANSICLDNVITGNGTTFTSYLSANDKIYYDDREYNVVSVTDGAIVVDDYLRATTRFPVFKIIDEVPFLDLTEDLVDPDGIITSFTLPGQIMGDSTVLDGLTTRVRRANGTYQTVNASQPTDAAQSLFQEELLRRTKEILTQMKYDLRDDAIRELSSALLAQRISETDVRLKTIKEDIDNVIEQDIAVYNQVKGLVKGMIKLFSMSCSKKKRKDSGGNATDSDDYLDLITSPNPNRLGCDATESDFIDILDDFDKEYNDPNVSSNNVPIIDTTIPSTNLFDDLDGVAGPFPRQTTGAGGDTVGGGLDDQDPDVTVPENPCAKPC